MFRLLLNLAACILVAVIGLEIWSALSGIAVAVCPEVKIWIGAQSGNKYCRWPLPVFLVKDILGASVMGAMIATTSVFMAPTPKRMNALSISLIFCLVGFLFLLASFVPHKHVALHRVGVGLTFGLVIIGVSMYLTRNASGDDEGDFSIE